MTNEVAVKNETVIQNVDIKTVTEYMDATGLTQNLLPNEKTMFINMAQMYGLNPFKREIYCTAFGEGRYRQCSIVTGYEVYLKRAERIGKLDGWECSTDGTVKDKTLSATVTIHRKDWTHPFKHTVYFRECCQTKKDGSLNHFWEKQPYFMTKKVAIAQAFRLCFPDEFGGMPYTSDELGVEQEAPIVERNVTPPKASVIAPAAQKQPEPEPAPAVPEEPAPAAAQVAAPTDARLVLEQLLNDHGIELRSKTAKVQPYTLAKNCLDNPASTDEELTEMYNRCVSFLRRKGISGV